MCFTHFAPLDEVAARQLWLTAPATPRGYAGVPRWTGCGRRCASRTPPLTWSKDGRTLFAWTERANTIFILHEPCHSAAPARARHLWSAPSSN
jgi:hypothetical protein